MFNTDMHIITFIILMAQVLVLFSQFLFYLSRPEDKSRLRFLILTVTYVLYNFFSGIFPDEQFLISVYLQNIIAYLVGILVAVYFIYYIYKEFDIYPFKYFDVRTLSIVLFFSFIAFFAIPYYFSGNLTHSRKLFIIIPVVVAVLFVYQIGRELVKLYKNLPNKNVRDNYFGMRVISGYLGLVSLASMPIVVALGDYQYIEQPLVNSGFIIMTMAYIADLVHRSKREAKLLATLKLRKKLDSKRLQQIPVKIETEILNGPKDFEDKKDFLTKNVTVHTLAKKYDTNDKYLSATINTKKNKHFNKYINHLRIEYALERLKSDCKFRKYTISHIADEVGFNTTESFSRAFFKFTGWKPSEYIKSMQE